MDRDDPVFDVIAHVADAEGVDPAELPPLFETIDPEAVIAVARSGDPDVFVEFVYHGYLVGVRGDGTVGITDADD